MNYVNKQQELKDKILKSFPNYGLVLVGEFTGKRWEFVVEHPPSNPLSKEQEQELQDIAKTVDPDCNLYVLPANA